MSNEETFKDEQGNTHYGKNMLKTIQYVPKNGENTVNIKIDESKIAKDLRAENESLKQSVGDLESKLTIIAEEKFNARKAELETEIKRLGLTANIESPNDLKAMQKLIEQNQGNRKTNSRDIKLNAYQTGNVKTSPDNTGKPIEERQYSNNKQLFDDLELEHLQGNTEATKILHTLTRKSAEDLVKGSEYEFTGKITKSHDPEEKLKWRKVR